MKYVYSSSDLTEAHLLLHRLEHEGIPAIIHGEDLMGAIGGLPFGGLVRVSVDDEDFEKACGVIRSMEAAKPPPRPAEASPASPGFSAKPMSGILAGVFVVAFILAAVYDFSSSSPARVAAPATPEQAAALRDAYAALAHDDFPAALKIFQPLAEQGNAKAERGLGVMYKYGFGVPQNYPAAITWLRKAADQGEARAEYDIAWMYWRGDGVRQDFGKGQQLLFRAANHGSTEAQGEVAAMYEDGNGVKQDYAEAYFWYRLAEKMSANTVTLDHPGLPEAKAKVAAHLTPEQITAADKRVGEWVLVSAPE